MSVTLAKVGVFIRMNENQLMNYPFQHVVSIVESAQIEESQIVYYGFTEWATLKLLL